MQSDRINKIQQHLYNTGFSNVQDLAEATGASIVTIRRDLQRPEETGAVTRTHGGARRALRSPFSRGAAQRPGGDTEIRVTVSCVFNRSGSGAAKCTSVSRSLAAPLA